MFNLCLEILFILIKSDPNIKRIDIFEYCYLHTAYADDTTLFLKGRNSSLFSDFSGLKPNTTKCKIPGKGVLKGVQAAVHGLRCIDLRKKTIKILGIYFS